MPSFARSVPDGDTLERAVCTQCGFVDYQNPKVVAGSVVEHDGQVLLCRRAIEPRRGFWTLPAGYLELMETVEEGAMREAWEEAEARIALDGVLAVYSISRIGQVQVLFRARFDGPPHFAAGPESLEVRLFAWDAIPWEEIAFPSVHWALQAWREGAGRPLGPPAGNPASDPRGVGRLAVGVVMRWLTLILALTALPAAAQQRGLNLTVPNGAGPLLPVPTRPFATSPPASPFEPAPLPNRDLEGPTGPRASNAPTVAPSLFTRSDQYRGDGFSRGSTAQTEQERKLKPGAGFNLKLPFSPN